MDPAEALRKLDELHAQGALSAAELQQARARVLAGAPPQHDAALRAILPVGRTALSVVAGYFGLLSLLVLPAPVALLLGIWALVDLKNKPGKSGAGRAWFAIATGSAGTGLLIWLALTT